MAEFSANQPPKKSFTPSVKIPNVDATKLNFVKSGSSAEFFQKEYDNLSYEEKKMLHEMFHTQDKFSESYKSLQYFIFKEIPPSPEDFLNPANGWVTQRYVDKLFQWVKDDFIEICNGKKNYDRIVEYGSTRLGKSHLGVLIILYIIVWIHHLRDMNLFYDMSPGSSLSVFIMSFNYNKVSQVYLKPLYNLLEVSPRFVKVKTQDAVTIEQKKIGISKIVWSKASVSDNYCITLASGLQLAQGNDDALSIIGENVLACLISELSFYIENAGATEEGIFRIYTDVSERIHGTVGNNRFAFVYLDSSANREDSKIESHLLKELRYRENTMFRWRRRWDVPELHEKNFPVWKKTGETFLICTGDGSNPPKIFEKGESTGHVPVSLLQEVPIDAYNKFKDNLVKSIKDICGSPTVSTSKFIQSTKLIDNIWDEHLQNIEGIITADSSEAPEQLIWNQVSDKFFSCYDGKNYRIKRAPKEPRWLHLDTAFSVRGDVCGISMVHKEFSQELEDVVYVADFSFTIGPGENGINLESLGWFISDMVSIGQLTLNLVTVDTFQSETMIQFLRREGIPTEKLSVDTSLEPYMFLYSCLLQENLRVGKNVFLKNNLNSLYRKRGKTGREKIDHTLGTVTNIYNGDFEKSSCGVNAKDCSDSLAGALFNAQKASHYPVYHFEKENERLYGAGGVKINAKTPVFSPQIKELYKSIHKQF